MFLRYDTKVTSNQKKKEPSDKEEDKCELSENKIISIPFYFNKIVAVAPAAANNLPPG